MKNEARNAKRLPLVIISPYEHHSNEITWEYQLCDLLKVDLADDGTLCMDSLKSILETHSNAYNKIIISMSAGSNVSGVKTDVLSVSKLAKH